MQVSLPPPVAPLSASLKEFLSENEHKRAAREVSDPSPSQLAHLCLTLLWKLVAHHLHVPQINIWNTRDGGDAANLRENTVGKAASLTDHFPKGWTV